jgi:ABC-type nitrate/sulfonate/bicarbonate transport system substrate-binding protein
MRQPVQKMVRVNAVNADFVAAHHSTVLGFLKTHKKSIDWAFSGEPAVAAYAKRSDQRLDVAKHIVKEFASQATDQLDEIREDRVLAEALAAKLIPHALTRETSRGYMTWSEARLLTEANEKNPWSE